ncbi:MAG: DUF2934 domain-containing protein [Alphaproteobacteria bacterium]|nr:DUF2934 domain-containing protein [Alphaproteobacteria bacterium]
MVKISENAIREAAYYNWQNAGCPQGQDEYFWAMAVEQLNGASAVKKTSSKTTAKTASVTAKTAAAKTTAAKKKTTAKK